MDKKLAVLAAILMLSAGLVMTHVEVRADENEPAITNEETEMNNAEMNNEEAEEGQEGENTASPMAQ